MHRRAWPHRRHSALTHTHFASRQPPLSSSRCRGPVGRDSVLTRRRWCTARSCTGTQHGSGRGHGQGHSQTWGQVPAIFIWGSSDAQLQTLHDLQANVLEQGPGVGKRQGGIQQLEAEGAVQIVVMRDGLAPALGAGQGRGRLCLFAGSRGARPLVGRPQLSQAALQQRTAHGGRGTGNTAGTPANSARRHKSSAPQVRRRRRCRGPRRAVRETSSQRDATR
jgi:hypothetical protein